MSTLSTTIHSVFTMRWKPSKDLIVVALSWLLVVSTLYTATSIVGSDVWGGMAYFALYAVVGALVFGVGVPLSLLDGHRPADGTTGDVDQRWTDLAASGIAWFSRSFDGHACPGMAGCTLPKEASYILIES